ncbi:MAG: GntR family transcriptional regulator [Planctomycetota bacterium]|jgi:DNA-binding LacI/PurR family transcriptional regulator|nr:GntR family transcriptional regulator [Planctomycetota bacterium]
MAEPLYADSPRSRAVRLLREWINTGVLPNGEQLPSERALANKLGVPRTTVNRALAELQAAGLIEAVSGRTRIVVADTPPRGLLARSTVILAPPHEDPHTPTNGMVEGCLSELRAHDHHVLILNARDLESDDLASLAAEGPRGVITVDLALGRRTNPELITSLLEQLHTAGIPVCCYGAEMAADRFDHVDHDHEAGAYALTQLLITRGRRRILQHFVAGRTMVWTTQRRAGYERAMREASLEPLAPFEMPDFESPDGNLDAQARQETGFLYPHLTGAEAIDGLLCLTDIYTFSAAAVCQLAGREPGVDLDIVGYDNYYQGAAERYQSSFRPLATIDRQTGASGHSLARLLVKRLAQPHDPSPLIEALAPKLIQP